ncbi:hypothetical protein F4778DRAFT_741846 [Xylariomycetidae sp. FL2044]|nr:hypothetical protein F4778DRAFT_741846 [Xylariomycetidae sp. FL2044]
MLFSIAAFAASLAVAAASNATGPFAIHIKGKEDTSIDGYVSASHAGAAIEMLTYSTEPLTEFYFNYSAYNPDTGEVFQPGWISYDLPAQPAIPSVMGLVVNWGSNVALAQFTPGYTSDTYIYYHPENGSFYLPGGVDDSHFNATFPGVPAYLGNLSNWYLCYQYSLSYYYRSVAFVIGGEQPRNPSCEPVDLIMELP